MPTAAKVAGTKKELLEEKPADVQKKIMDGRIKQLENK
jgi:hypothetical protein